MANRGFDHWKHILNFHKYFARKEVSNRIPTKFVQVISMIRGLWLIRSVLIWWLVLILSCKQAIFCSSVPRPWPWVRITERSSSTFPQIYHFFVPNIYGLAHTVSTWGANVAVWASCQIRKIAGAHAPGMPGTFSPSPHVSDPDMHHDTCVTHVPWCMPESLTSGFLWNRRRGETFPAFSAHAQPAILRIW